MTVTYTVGDTREVIKGIPDGSVDLLATSPPFYQLRSYVGADHESKSSEIGSEPDPATFLDTLLALTAEWGRVLASHGSIAVELGDTYSGSGGPGGDYNEGGLRQGQGKADGSARAQRQTNSLKANPKSLACIPDLYTIALAYGIHPLTGKESPAGKWLVRNKIVWHRPNPAVGALGDKVRPSTSYIVIATRSPKRWFDLTAVRTAPGPVGGQTVANGKPTGSRNDDDMPHLTANHPAGAPPLDAWFDPYDGSHDTWTLTTQPSRLAHYAMWPAKLAERLVLMMCPLAVCRVCGEPRRRIETSIRTLGDSVDANTQRRRDDAHAMGRNGRTVGLQSYMTSGGSTDRTTTGWTDCGCACPTCGGEGLLPADDDKNRWLGIYPECPDCMDGRAFRPGLVLDPFCGSGTSLAVADLHGRDAIGIDFNSENKLIYPARYTEVSRALFGTQPELPGQLGMFDEVPA